jgi:hypothetical protein
LDKPTQLCKKQQIGLKNIVTLIENNPIIKLNGDYQSKLVNKIKGSFTDTQQLFVSSFYCYLNYGQASEA